jgi:hypothetical protein
MHRSGKSTRARNDFSQSGPALLIVPVMLGEYSIPHNLVKPAKAATLLGVLPVHYLYKSWQSNLVRCHGPESVTASQILDDKLEKTYQNIA